jgi:hypothetical protein
MFVRGSYTLPAATGSGSSIMLFAMQGSVTNMIHYYVQTSLTTAWTGGTTGVFNAGNAANLQARFQTGRVLSGGIRIRCLNAATSAPPVFYAGNIFDSIADIAALTPSQTIPQNQLRPITNLNNAVEVLYRPGDLSDYELLAGVVAAAGTSSTTAFVTSCVVVNWPAGGSIIVDALYHFEGNSGVDITGEDEEGITVADELPSPESALRIATKSMPIETRDVNPITSSPTVLDRFSSRHHGHGLASAASILGQEVAAKMGWDVISSSSTTGKVGG